MVFNIGGTTSQTKAAEEFVRRSQFQLEVVLNWKFNWKASEDVDALLQEHFAGVGGIRLSE